MIPIEERIATFLANTQRDDKATALLAEAARVIRELRQTHA